MISAKSLVKSNFEVKNMRIIPITLYDMIKANKKIKWCIKWYDDRKYWTTDRDGLEIIVEDYMKKKRKYVKDRFDCDDFSRTFKCFCIEHYGINAVGLVRDPIPRHAYNTFVTYDGYIYVVEPQTGEIFRFEDRPKKYYRCLFALIIY